MTGLYEEVTFLCDIVTKQIIFGNTGFWTGKSGQLKKVIWLK